MRWFVLLALAGCGDSGSPADAGMDLSTHCSGMLSGVVEEAITDCAIVFSEHDGVTDVATNSLTLANPSAISNPDFFGFIYRITGNVQTGSYSKTNLDSYQATVPLELDGGVGGYAANFSVHPNGPPNIGSLTAELTSFDFDAGSTTDGSVHGNVRIHMVPADKNQTFGGSVDLALDF
jgi:hypothetical protein